MGKYPFLQTSSPLGSDFRLFVSGNPIPEKKQIENILAPIQNKASNIQIRGTQANHRAGSDQLAIFDLSLSSEGDDLAQLIEYFRKISQETQVDFNLLPRQWVSTWPRLLVFDVDSTLIAQETIDELAKFAHAKDKVSEITRQAMEGKIGFQEALRSRLALLKGLTISEMRKVMDVIEIRPDMLDLVETAKSRNIQIALVSGGFNFVVQKLANQLGATHYFANELKFHSDVFSGELEGEIVNGVGKAKYIEKLVQELNMGLEDVYCGQSAVIDPWGDFLSLAGIRGEALCLQDIHKEVLLKSRIQLDTAFNTAELYKDRSSL